MIYWLIISIDFADMAQSKAHASNGDLSLYLLKHTPATPTSQSSRRVALKEHNFVMTSLWSNGAFGPRQRWVVN